MDLEGLILRYRSTVYVLINVAVALAAMFGMAAGNASAGSAVYASVLFMLCSVPALWLQRFNDRYALLAIFMGTYYLFFGALSLRNVILGPDIATLDLHPDVFLTSSQFAVLVGAVLVLVGYRIASALIPPVAADAAGSDFSNATILFLGLLCWILGSIAMAYYSIVVTTENTVEATRKGIQSMGPVLTFIVMLGNLMQPVGTVMLAYGYAKNRTPFWLALVVAMALLQVALGFIVDTKGLSLMGVLLVAITTTLWDNRLSKAWVVGLLVFAMVVFPVMQAGRAVRGETGFNRAQAYEHIGEILQRAWESREKVNEGKSTERAQTFLERSSTEKIIEPIFERAGVDTPYLAGITYEPLLYTFIPRLLLPDKIDVAPGQLYNHVFLHAPSNDFTYISLSELGEFYWNFGWAGVIGGMLLTGLLLGVVGAKSCLTERRSMTRLLILLVSIMQLCFGFGGALAVPYTVWLRALAAIGLMHLVFARPVSSRAQGSNLPASLPAGAPKGTPALPAFPNLMR